MGGYSIGTGSPAGISSHTWIGMPIQKCSLSTSASQKCTRTQPCDAGYGGTDFSNAISCLTGSIVTTLLPDG